MRKSGTLKRESFGLWIAAILGAGANDENRARRTCTESERSVERTEHATRRHPLGERFPRTPAPRGCRSHRRAAASRRRVHYRLHESVAMARGTPEGELRRGERERCRRPRSSSIPDRTRAIAVASARPAPARLGVDSSLSQMRPRAPRVICWSACALASSRRTTSTSPLVAERKRSDAALPSATSGPPRRVSTARSASDRAEPTGRSASASASRAVTFAGSPDGG